MQIKEMIGQAGRVTIRKPLFSSPGKDIPAGIVVFLVALPLCLGIALASGAPLISGLISGIIGGIVIGGISQSDTSVSGPAASISAVVLVAIQKLGSFEVFLMALVIGGIMQLILGLLRTGLIADYIPTSIIKGLLAAIGIILIFSQIPYAVGVELDSRIVDYSRDFILESPENILLIIKSLSPGAILISIISLGLLIFWDRTFLRKFKLLPPSLVVVFIGVILNFFYRFLFPTFYLEGIHLVNIPDVDQLSSLFTFPDFSAAGNMQVWVYGFTIAIIASIASLLNLEATDNMDRHKRRSPPNRELIAQGIGNTLAGLVGGIPITSVIVRSSVNIQAGGETKLSTIIHGILLLLSILFLSSVINLIPLASLASILLVVGYRLASIPLFKNMYKKGLDQFLPFIVTTVAILVTDVLAGVLIGSLISVFFLLRGNYYNPFQIESIKTKDGENIRLELSNEVSFLNKPAFKKTLWNLPENSRVIIDATFSTYIEPDIIGILDDFRNTFAPEHSIHVIITGLREKYDQEMTRSLVRGLVKTEKKISTPQEILEYLMEGNRRYVDGELVSRRYRNKELIDFIREAPLAAVINCIDMREPLNMILNTNIGDLILLRSAGNLVSDQMVCSIEIACRKQGARLIVLMGNSGNSFIGEALEDLMAGRESYLGHLIAPAFDSGSFQTHDLKPESLPKMTDRITRWNLEESKNRILERNAFIREAVAEGRLGICVCFFQRESGKILFTPLTGKDRTLIPDQIPET